MRDIDANTSLPDLADYVTLEDVLELLGRLGHLNLHAADPSAPEDSLQYNTAVHHWADGDVVATTAADAKHDHWGVYTRRHPTGHANPSRLKRLNVQGGSEDTVLRTYSPRGDNQFRMSADGHSRLLMEAGGSTAKVNWLLDPDCGEDGAYRLHDLEHGHGILDVHLREEGPVIDLLGNPVRNVGPVLE
ncbi:MULTISPECIES: hypothetical protein [Halorussus]|uniref:hypothetical protein n=1 Tax=Halorussus TaxID=1070314 RepID=UPI0020A22F57|nr:hypothetical protein [Halorussus vallis]USZ77361.1 hypothetical protein NGM07_08520 [Halorussus vallis]